MHHISPCVSAASAHHLRVRAPAVISVPFTRTKTCSANFPIRVLSFAAVENPPFRFCYGLGSVSFGTGNGEQIKRARCLFSACFAAIISIIFVGAVYHWSFSAPVSFTKSGPDCCFRSVILSKLSFRSALCAVKPIRLIRNKTNTKTKMLDDVSISWCGTSSLSSQT